MKKNSTRFVRILCNLNTSTRRRTRRDNSAVCFPLHFESYSYYLPEFPQIFISLSRIVCKKPGYVSVPQTLSSLLLPASALLPSFVAGFSSIGFDRDELGENPKRSEGKNRNLSSSSSVDHLLPQGESVSNKEEWAELGQYDRNSNLPWEGEEYSVEKSSSLDRDMMTKKNEVEEICKILREDNDFETSLEAMVLKLSPGLVQRVLSNCHRFEELAKRFFVWTKSQRGYVHTSETYNEMVKIAVRKRDFKYVAYLLARMKTEGLSASKTFAFLMREGEDEEIVGEMLKAFIRVRFPEPKDAYDALLPQLCQANHLELALAAIQGMIRAGYRPVPQTYVALSGAWCERGRVHRPQEILGQMRKHGYRPDGNTCNYILKALCAIGKVDEAYAFLDSMRLAGCEPDSLSYHIMIWGACEIGEVDGALQLLERMIVHESFTPRQKTYTIIIRALDRTRECIKAYDLITFLNDRECFPNYHNYQMVAEMCYENYETIAAAKILLQMTKKGYIPHIKLRQRVFHSLIGKGEEDLAWKFRNRLMDLRS